MGTNLAKILLFSTIYFSTSSLQLFMDGGAREEGLQAFSSYEGVLSYIKILWFSVAIVFSSLHLTLIKKMRISRIELKILLFSGYILLSSIWSQDVLMAVKTAIALIITLEAIKACVSTLGPRDSIILAGKSLSSLLIGSLLISTFLPNYGVSVGIHDGAWQGIFTHKNELGSFCLLSISFFFGFSPYFKKSFFLFSISLSLFLSIMSQSTSSLIGILLTTIASILLYRSTNLLNIINKFRLSTIIAAFSLALAPLAIFIISPITSFLSKDTSFSGRGSIWEYFIYKFLDAPYFGHGLNQFNAASNKSIETILGFIPASAHNGILDALLSIGIFGSAVFAIIISSLSKGGKYLFRAHIIFLIGIFIINGTESQLISFNIWFTAIALYISINIEEGKNATTKIHQQKRV